MHRLSPTSSGSDGTLNVLTILQDPNVKPGAARLAFEEFVYEQLRGGAKVRDLLGVIKSMKRQLPKGIHILITASPTLPSQSLLRLPALVQSPSLSKKSVIEALSNPSTRQYITTDQALELLLEYCWSKFKAVEVDVVAKKVWEIEFELQTMASITSPIQSALRKIRYDIGFVSLSQLVARLNALNLTETGTEWAKAMLQAWLRLRLGCAPERVLKVDDRRGKELWLKLTADISEARIKLPVGLRSVLESLTRHYNLSLRHQRSSGSIVPSYPYLDLRRPSLPILSASNLEQRLSSQAALSATDVVSYTRQRRFGHSNTPVLSITSIPQYSPSQSSSPSISERSFDFLPSPISIRRALQLPRCPDEPVPSLPPPRRESPVASFCSLRPAAIVTETPVSSPFLAPPSASRANSPISLNRALRLSTFPVQDLPPVPSSPAVSSPQVTPSKSSCGSPISIKRALDLPEIHDPMPELSHPFSQRDRSVSLLMPMHDRLFGTAETHRPPSVFSTNDDCPPSPTSTAHIEFATREFALEAKAVEFELPSPRMSINGGESQLGLGSSHTTVESSQHNLSPHKYRRASIPVSVSVSDADDPCLGSCGGHCGHSTRSNFPTADFPASPPLSPSSPDSLYSQGSFFPAEVKPKPSHVPTLAPIPASPLSTNDFGPSSPLPSAAYTFPPRSSTMQQEPSPRGSKRRGLVLSKLPFRSRLTSLDSTARASSDIRSFDRAQRDAFINGDEPPSPGDLLVQAQYEPRRSQDSVRTLERIITPYFLGPPSPTQSSSFSMSNEPPSSDSAPASSTLAPVFGLFAASQSANRPSPKKAQAILLEFVRSERAAVLAKGLDWSVEKDKVLWIVDEAARMLHEAPYGVVFDHVRLAISKPHKVSADGLPETPTPAARRRPATAPTSSQTTDAASPAPTFGRKSYETPRRPSLLPRSSDRSDGSASSSWTQAGASPGTPTSVRGAQHGESPHTPVTSRPALLLRTSSGDLGRITENSASGSGENEVAPSVPLHDSTPSSTRVAPISGRWSSDSNLGIGAKEAPPSYWDSMTPIDSD